jgi:hypothetical protein
MLRRVILVRPDFSEELIASIIRVTRIGEPGRLAVTSNRCTLRSNLIDDGECGRVGMENLSTRKKPASVQISTTNFTWPTLGSIPGLRDGKLLTHLHNCGFYVERS